MISSTSWTEDEDFSILLDALVLYDKKKSSTTKPTLLPNLIVIITGKGPQKTHYQQIITNLHFDHIKIHLEYLPHDDYPRLLGCADLGISLHTSSSGLDLPMKIVDMFGCGVPVLAVGYRCIGELVFGKRGVVFGGREGLLEALCEFMGSFKSGEGRFEVERGERWEEGWDRECLPLFGNY